MGLVILFAAAIRIRLLDIPLERDEGEYAYVGQLMLEGVAPYKMAYVVKLPGTAAAYALSMMLFGQTAVGIHLGLLLANIAAIVLVFLLGRRWFDGAVGLIAAATYALMSLSWCCTGTAAHATQFIVPVAIGGILLLWRGLETGRLATLFCSGLLFGLAFLLKQPGLLFGLFGGLCIVARERKLAVLQKAALYCAGMALPFAALCLIEWRAGVFDRFWFWSFTVAGGGWTAWSQMVDNLSVYAQWIWSSRDMLFWMIGAVSLAAAWWLPAVRPIRLAFLAFCGASFAATSVGMRFNSHYFVMSLPALGLLVGLGVAELTRILRQSKAGPAFSLLPAALYCAVCGSLLYSESGYLFTDPPAEVGQRIYLHNPFREAAEVAAYVKTNSAPGDQIAVLGSEPEIYFLSHRRAATGHLSAYILMEDRPWTHSLQEQMAREIISARPAYIVLVKNKFSWLVPDHADRTMVNAVLAELHAHYHLTGLAISPRDLGQPVYYWGAAADGPHPEAQQATSWITVFKRVNST